MAVWLPDRGSPNTLVPIRMRSSRLRASSSGQTGALRTGLLAPFLGDRLGRWTILLGRTGP